MNIVIVDDEPLSLAYLIQMVHSVCTDSKIEGFRSAQSALEYIKENSVDVAFLDIAMPEMNGLQLAKCIKEAQSKTNIIFVTAYSQYALDAHGLYVTGYLIKPATKEDIKVALDNLRLPVASKNHKIKVRTFGGFEIYVNGKKIHFKRSKTKELLAYLIDRKGFSCTMQQIVAVLWDGEDIGAAQKSYLRNLIAEMMSTLRAAGAEEIVIKDFNSLSVNTTMFQCDYYDFLDGKPESINAYTSEYIPEYSWAEFTLGMLEERKQRK